MEITAIASALSSLKTAAELAKLIKESGHNLEKAELKLKLADLISALADAKIEVAEIQQTVLELEAELRTLREKLEIKDSLVWKSPCYWRPADKGLDGPFCQKCYDADQKLIRLQGHNDGHWTCASCKSTFMEERYVASLQSRNICDYDPYV